MALASDLVQQRTLLCMYVKDWGMPGLFVDMYQK